MGLINMYIFLNFGVGILENYMEFWNFIDLVLWKW